MFRPFATTLSTIIPTTMRAAFIGTLLLAPPVAVSFAGDQGTQIEAPAQKKIGAGFVLLISLQRN